MKSSAPAAPSAARAHAPDLSISQELAGFAAAVTPGDVPARVQERAKLHMLDVIGTALAATKFDFAHRALAGLVAAGEPGKHTVIGMPVKLLMRDAALLNGILRARARLRRHTPGCDRASEQQLIPVCAERRGEDRRKRRGPHHGIHPRRGRGDAGRCRRRGHDAHDGLSHDPHRRALRLRHGRGETVNRGAGNRALTSDDITAKFMDNAELVLSRDKAQRIRDFVLELEHHTARELGARLSGQE